NGCLFRRGVERANVGTSENVGLRVIQYPAASARGEPPDAHLQPVSEDEDLHLLGALRAKRRANTSSTRAEATSTERRNDAREERPALRARPRDGLCSPWQIGLQR